jgi:hypothetical protein
MAQPRAHVYLFRGLADVFSLGMNTLTDELNSRGVAATVHSHTDWKSIADKAAENYKAGREGPGRRRHGDGGLPRRKRCSGGTRDTV